MTNQDSQTKSPFGDRRTALAFFLSLIVIITYTELIIKPNQPPIPPQPAKIAQQNIEQTATEPETGGPQIATSNTTESLQAPTSSEIEAAPQKPQVTLTKDVPLESDLESAGQTTVTTPQYRAVISHLGGRLLHFELLNHTDNLEEQNPMDLVSRSEKTPLPLGVSLLGGTDAKLSFPSPSISVDGKATQSSSITIPAGKEARVAFQIPLTDGGTFTKSYRFVGNSYLIDFEAALSEKPSASADPIAVRWNAYFPEEITESSYDPVSFSLFLASDSVEHLPVAKFEEKQKDEQVSRWASLGDKYFMASLISVGEPLTTSLERNGDEYAVTAIGSQQTVKTKVFLGPKNYSELKDIGFELHRNVNFGIFSLLAIPLLTVIHFFYGLFGNYGLAIILLTLLIKTMFLPLTQVSFRSMKAMQDLQPEIKALRERISDPNQLNQEMFALYKRKGVNPMGGCFPMLIQIPVFLGLYNALLNATELRHSPFALWITDLSAPEALLIAGIPVPVMILMMGISMFFQQYLTPSNMDEQQKKIMMMMPVMFTVMFIIFPFPSGLVLYWLVNNLISIVQQVYLRTDRSMGPTQATILASIGIFLVGYTLTLL